MMFTSVFPALLLAAACPLASTLEERGPSVGKDKGTFENPSVHVRPKFRYWIPDASVDPTVAASDVKAAGDVGAAGIEALGFYLYGGPPSNGGRGVAAPVSWATYGFGTEAWNSLFKSIVQAHKDNDLIMDFAVGPNQGTGVPAHIDSDGLMWDLAAFNVSVSVGGSFSGTLPGWGTGTLEAAVTGLVTQSQVLDTVAPGLPGDVAESRTQFTLSSSSLEDVTSKVDKNGHLEVQFPPTQAGLDYPIFAVYLIHSDYRAQDGPEDIGGPQTPAHTIAQNGSWAVDHFSSLGAETTTNFWEQNILQNGTRELLMEVGNYGWEDSVEIDGNVYWTKNMLDLFQKDHGYSISKYLPILFHRNGHAKSSNPPVWWVTDESDSGDSHIADYRQTLGEQYQSYLSTLTSWAEDYLGLTFSAQVSYNLPMDMLANIPSVGIPECETLDFSDLIDGYRQYAGPANFAQKPVVSSECGAVPGEAFTQTLPELMWKVKRSYAGSVNMFVFHGFPYSGNYGNTTWPVYTTFNYQYSEMHGPGQPAWDFYRDQIDYVARNNFVLQSGVPKLDVAFWEKITTVPGHVTARWYDPTDLEQAGYTYEYLSPDNFDLPSAQVQGGVLAPDAQAFKAMVVRANDSLTLDGATKLVEFARAGLAIVFSGGIPSSYLGTNNPSAVSGAQGALEATASLHNVHVVKSYDGLAATLASIGIQPAAKFITNATASSIYTTRRSDASTGIDYYYVYNDAPTLPRGEGSAQFAIEFSSTGHPVEYDAWTGEQTPVLTYTVSDKSTTIPLELAGNQTTIIAFLPEPVVAATPTPTTHLTSTSEGIIGASAMSNGSLVLKVGPSSAGPASFALSDGTTQTASAVQASPITLTNWNLIVEHWDPPSDLFDIEGGAAKHNTTHSLPNLVSWQQVPGLQNVSGRGYYSTTFAWSQPPSPFGRPAGGGKPDGAVIDFGFVLHTLRVWVNGHALPPLDVAAARADISQWLVPGENKVEAVVATPLGNVLRPIWDQLETSGMGPSNPAAGGPAPPAKDYGLLKDVVVTPYREVIVV